MKSRALKLFNGRPYFVLKLDDDAGRNAHANIAAYSVADARRVCKEYTGLDPGYTEVTKYFSPCWGIDMDGIEPKRGIWIARRGEKPVLVYDGSVGLTE